MIDALDTDRLVLRPITLADAHLLLELDSDPEVMRYLTGRPSTRTEVEAIIRARLGCRWIASEQRTGSFIGWLELVPGPEGSYEIGYRLLREWWGGGFATEGTGALIEAAFRFCQATRVTAQTMAVNDRSWAVMERCGMRYSRTFHLEWDDPLSGTEEGEVEYELTRTEWEGSSPPPIT